MTSLRKPRSDAQIFTGTLADVSFLLVIFFMVTAAFAVAKGLDLGLGEPPREDQPLEAWEAVDVHVQADGSLVVDGSPMAMEGLLPYVASRLEPNPDKPVILRAEPAASYGSVIRVLDELRQSSSRMGFDIPNLAIPTYREQHLYAADLFGRW
jgi:biopolymer transport protein ExbD